MDDLQSWVTTEKLENLMNTKTSVCSGLDTKRLRKSSFLYSTLSFCVASRCLSFVPKLCEERGCLDCSLF